MIVHEVVQGSAEWLKLRAGIPTASQFHRVITPKKGEPSAQAEGLICDLVAERFMGRPLASAEMPWMKEGLEREPKAAEYYEIVNDVKLLPVGLCTTDDGKIGASPDRLIEGVDDGLVEIKCPQVQTHIGYMLGKGPDETYRVQLQGQLLVTEREWVDIISYYPGLPHVTVRVHRDEEFIGKLRKLLYDVIEQVDKRMEELKARGYEPRQEEEEPGAQWLITDEDIAALDGWFDAGKEKVHSE